MNHKINAYTLMEVTVAMLVAAICITICYTAYGLMANYYLVFKEKNDTIDSVLMLKQTMERDLLNGEHCFKITQGFQLQGDSDSVNYLFNEKDVIRKVGKLKADTFHLKVSDLVCEFEQQTILELDTIDRISFKILLPEAQVVPILLKKKYSAENLFH